LSTKEKKEYHATLREEFLQKKRSTQQLVSLEQRKWEVLERDKPKPMVRPPVAENAPPVFKNSVEQSLKNIPPNYSSEVFQYSVTRKGRGRGITTLNKKPSLAMTTSEQQSRSILKETDKRILSSLTSEKRQSVHSIPEPHLGRGRGRSRSNQVLTVGKSVRFSLPMVESNNEPSVSSTPAIIPRIISRQEIMEREFRYLKDRLTHIAESERRKSQGMTLFEPEEEELSKKSSILEFMNFLSLQLSKSAPKSE